MVTKRLNEYKENVFTAVYHGSELDAARHIETIVKNSRDRVVRASFVILSKNTYSITVATVSE